MLRGAQLLLALARDVSATASFGSALHSYAPTTLGRILGSFGATTSAGDQAQGGLLRRDAASALSASADAKVEYPSLTAHQARRMAAILRQRQITQSIEKRMAAKKHVGESVEWPVRQWAPLLMKGTDAGEVGSVTLPGRVFNRYANPQLLHLAVRWQLAKRRAGTHSTKTRAEVRGGGKKPWKQKGTGRARHGSIRSPQWRGGGIVHGPKPRDYAFKLNKMVRRAALRAAISAKAQAGQLIIVDRLSLTEAEAAELTRRQLLEHKDVLENLDAHRVKHAGYGLRQWVIRKLQGETPPADADVVGGIMASLRKEKVSFRDAQARTSVVRKHIQHLLPQGWDKAPDSILLSNQIVREINYRASPERLEQQEKQRLPEPRLSMLIVDSSKDGADGGALLRGGVSNIPGVDVLPVVGANVYDVIRHEVLVMTLPALHAMIKRLTAPVNRGFKPLGYTLESWMQREAERTAQQKLRKESFPAWLEGAKRRRSVVTETPF